jgi:two-component system response regulator
MHIPGTDNANDVKLTMRALEKSNVSSEIVVVSNGEEAIDYLFATGRFAGRDPRSCRKSFCSTRNCPKLMVWVL